MSVFLSIMLWHPRGLTRRWLKQADSQEIFGVHQGIPSKYLLFSLWFISLIINDFYLQWVFTLGLSLSSTVDILITTTLCYNLETSRTGSSQYVFNVTSDHPSSHTRLFLKAEPSHQFVDAVHIREWVTDMVWKLPLSSWVAPSLTRTLHMWQHCDHRVYGMLAHNAPWSHLHGYPLCHQQT
jgi:hypothetical protein